MRLEGTVRYFDIIESSPLSGYLCFPRLGQVHLSFDEIVQSILSRLLGLRDWRSVVRISAAGLASRKVVDIEFLRSYLSRLERLIGVVENPFLLIEIQQGALITYREGLVEQKGSLDEFSLVDAT